MDELIPTDWIAERAQCLLQMALNLNEIEDKKGKDLVYRMMNKLVDSVIMPKEAAVTKLGVIVDNEE
jgi:hypothetical protein